jgi:hypothetical protein
MMLPSFLLALIRQRWSDRFSYVLKSLKQDSAPLTDKEAQRLLAALRAGKSLRAICAGMVGKRYVAGEKIAPDYQSFHNYCKAQPEYARQASELLAASLKIANHRKGAPKRSRTQCSRGHLFTPETTRYRKDPDDPRRERKICERDRAAIGAEM